MELNTDKYTPQGGSGISGLNRQRLEAVHRASNGVVTVQQVAEILGLLPHPAAKLLAHWHSQGWASRIRRGLYALVPLGAGLRAAVLADPWVVIARAFAPSYVGGWSACEHWGFTEQIFRAVFFFTAKPIRPRKGEIHGTPYVAKVVSAKRLFGTRRIWKDQAPVEVSDPCRTIIDILDDPAVGGGIRHVTQVVRAFFTSEYRNDALLIQYGLRLQNQTVFKRLGFLVEHLGIDAPELIRACKSHLSSGYSRLDPSGPRRGKLLRRWSLLINVQIPKAA